MKLLFVLLAALFISPALLAQSEVFDLVTYTAPKGWAKELTDNQVVYSKTGKDKKSWCRIIIIRSVPSKGSVEEDFKNTWEVLATEQYKATGLQENDIVEADGWKLKAGAGKFTYNNADAMILLTTVSGYGVCINILSTTNSQDFADDIETFLGAIDIKKPSAPPPANNAGDNNTSTSSAEFTFHTTNFDNGWTSSIKEDWVEVSKGDVTVYLWYALPYNASDYSGTGVQARLFYWENYVSRYFTIETTKYDNMGFLSDISQDLVEGWATNKQTGQRKYMAMRLFISTNAASIIIVAAPDEQSLLKSFPNYTKKYTDDIGPMSYYNRFAIGTNDITGTWIDGGTSAAYMYYTGATGTYGAMAVASTDSKFNFYKAGSYDCVEKSTMGHVGALSSYKAEYKGKCTVTNWGITLTNRFQGKTDNYNAWFEVVRGGRVLCLQDQQYSGVRYHLVKTK